MSDWIGFFVLFFIGGMLVVALSDDGLTVMVNDTPYTLRIK